MIKLPLKVVAVSVIALVIAATATPTVAARAALFNQVNDALTFGGFALTYENWLPFADGVVKGHYKTLDQLKGAAKFHQQSGTLPDRSKFGTAVAKAVASASGSTKCHEGNVLSLSGGTAKGGQVTLSKAGGNVKYNLTANQYKHAIAQSITNGNKVRACTKSATSSTKKALVGNLKKLDEGNSGSGGGGGGGGSSSSSGT